MGTACYRAAVPAVVPAAVVGNATLVVYIAGDTAETDKRVSDETAAFEVQGAAVGYLGEVADLVRGDCLPSGAAEVSSVSRELSRACLGSFTISPAVQHSCLAHICKRVANYKNDACVD